MNATSEYKSESDTLTAFISEKCVQNTVAKVHTTRLFQSFKEWAKENNEAEQIRSSRAMISLLRERGFDVSAGSQNKHYVHGLGLEAEETETWVNQVRKLAKYGNFLKNDPGFFKIIIVYGFS